MPSRILFVSYASGDREVVGPLTDLLEAAGIKVFFAPKSIQFGDVWQDSLWKALQLAERVLVFWSKLAAESKWVKREFRFALKQGCRVVPVPIDSTPLPRDLARVQGSTSMRDLLARAVAQGEIATDTEPGGRLDAFTRDRAPAKYRRIVPKDWGRDHKEYSRNIYGISGDNYHPLRDVLLARLALAQDLADLIFSEP